eukprot:8732861-Ditylum_brightwellii.AAC.1
MAMEVSCHGQKLYHKVCNNWERKEKTTKPKVPVQLLAEYVTTLKEWEYNLKANYEMVCNKEDVVDILHDDLQLFLACDGGKVDRLGYYDWIIYKHINILVCHKGHAAGIPDLLEISRTENVGALLLMYFKFWVS